jgi:hypothetical protein
MDMTREEDLRSVVAKFGEPKTLSVMEFRLGLLRFKAAHMNDDLFKIVSEKDLELALAYGRTIEEIMSLPFPVWKSLAEKYDESNRSLSSRNISVK